MQTHTAPRTAALAMRGVLQGLLVGLVVSVVAIVVATAVGSITSRSEGGTTPVGLDPESALVQPREAPADESFVLEPGPGGDGGQTRIDEREGRSSGPHGPGQHPKRSSRGPASGGFQGGR